VGRVLVVIPTYNEVGNVVGIVDRVRSSAPAVDVLIVDDASPDGTGTVADRLAAADRRVRVLHRDGKQGLGGAYVAGFAWARDHGYDAVVQMDADGSHAPEDLPRLVDAAAAADVVIGSRWADGGAVVNWPWHRLLLSRLGNGYTRAVLGVPVSDATGGFRVYRVPALQRVDVPSVTSQGFSFQVELSWRAHRMGLRCVEVPITFVQRQAGDSKMSPLIVAEALWRVTVWAVRQRGAALRRRLTRARPGWR
jgi:dolichol-phosphate mannosyltransferase